MVGAHFRSAGAFLWLKTLPKRLFNTRLDSNTVRAIDFHEGDTVDEAALRALILDAVRLNTKKVVS
jgi:hypothetical protein